MQNASNLVEDYLYLDPVQFWHLSSNTKLNTSKRITRLLCLTLTWPWFCWNNVRSNLSPSWKISWVTFFCFCFLFFFFALRNFWNAFMWRFFQLKGFPFEVHLMDSVKNKMQFLHIFLKVWLNWSLSFTYY